MAYARTTLGNLSSGFGSATHSYFRLRACVSLFDFRDLPDEQLLHALDACSPWSAARACNYQAAFFFLPREAYTGLKSGREWNPKSAPGQMVVPFVEVGHPGRIPLSSIDELWEVTLKHEVGLHESAFNRPRRSLGT